MSDLTVHVCLAPKKQPPSLTPSRPSDAPVVAPPPSVPQSYASEVIISPEGEQPSPAPSETPIEGEGVEGESSGGAFNPETGEINWDCPCLGGLAHGPCGQQFREAFSCFVHSEADPKGIDCVEKFKAMQDCFREHPDVYGDGMWIHPWECATVSFLPQKLWTTMRIPGPRSSRQQRVTFSPRRAFLRRRRSNRQHPHHPRIMDIIDTDLLHS